MRSGNSRGIRIPDPESPIVEANGSRSRRLGVTSSTGAGTAALIAVSMDGGGKAALAEEM